MPHADPGHPSTSAVNETTLLRKLMTQSPTANFLSQAIEKSGLTQREISERAGFAKPNILSMMKRGETKVPIERIPALAEACGANARDFLRVAMQEYHPDVWRVLGEVFDPQLTRRELDIIKMLNMADPDSEIEWMQQDADVLIALLKYMLSWMRVDRQRSGKAGSAPQRKS